MRTKRSSGMDPRQRVGVGAPVAKPKVEAKATAQAQVKPPAPKLPTPAVQVPSGVSLASALVAHGTSTASARAGIVRALSTELLLSTKVGTEELAGEVMAELGAGKAVDPQTVVQRALDSGGPLAVAELTSALAWRIGAAAADGADADLLERSGATLDALVASGVSALATRAPPDSRIILSTATSALGISKSG